MFWILIGVVLGIAVFFGVTEYFNGYFDGEAVLIVSVVAVIFLIFTTVLPTSLHQYRDFDADKLAEHRVVLKLLKANKTNMTPEAYYRIYLPREKKIKKLLKKKRDWRAFYNRYWCL